MPGPSRQDLINLEWQRAWTAAAQLLSYLSSGGTPAPIAVPLRLAPDERCYADLPLQYARYYGTAAHYTHTTGLFLGSPLFMAAGYAATAIGNSRARSKAQWEAAPRWRECAPCRAVLTSHRTMCCISGRWLTFDHGAIIEFISDLPRASSFFTFSDAEPLRLIGPGIPYLSVLLSYLLYGPALHTRPYLAPLVRPVGRPAITAGGQDAQPAP